MQASERRNEMREKITLIQALISTHDWKRGIITSNSINAKVDIMTIIDKNETNRIRRNNF